tara:strand:+ start:112 stop:336 length:225 start_codon:yes stop_codon:yes gene_type:complete
MLYISLENTWNAFVVKNKSDKFSEIKINLRNNLTTYHSSKALAIREVIKIIYVSINDPCPNRLSVDVRLCESPL